MLSSLSVLILSLLVVGSTANWADESLLTTTTTHGPDLKFKGDVFSKDGTYILKSGSSYVAKSVMTGRDSYFPTTLPEKLRTRFVTPDSTHPNLAFWYTPEVFEREGTRDGAFVEEWPNVANICYHGHTDTASCLWVKNQGTQLSNNKYVEAMKQPAVNNRPTYVKDVVNGHGVVRFSRGDKLGKTGQYLEMYKRCTNLNCSIADDTAGFLTDWTNSATPANTAYTMFLVVKTNQRSRDTNPMGIVNLVSTGAKTGFGLYKTEARCFAQYSGTLSGSNRLADPVTFLNVSSSSPPSDVPGTYNGLEINIYSATTDAETGVRHVARSCRVEQYIVVGSVKTALTTNIATVTLSGGAGAVGKITAAQIASLQPFLRFGPDISTAHAAGDVQVTASAASGDDTVLTFASTDFSTNNVAAGQLVFLGLSAGEFHTAVLSLCLTNSSVPTAAGETSFELVQPGAPDCNQGTYRQFSTVSAYYGGVQDEDNGCATECEAAGGCDPTAADFGANNTCVKKWGSRRRLQDPDKGWKVITVKASGANMQVFVDGVHGGCENADACTIVPPVDITGATPVTLSSFRLGLMAAEGSADADFASMDMAEVMVYDKALSVQEMDRIGNYLATKYHVSEFQVDRAIRSPTRSAAVTKAAGCDRILFSTHSAKVCDGFNGANCASGVSHVTLSSTLADEDTVDYYKGMRLSIKGGGSAIDDSIRTAAGQSCRITAYTPATRTATCDLTESGQSSFVLHGNETYPGVVGSNSVGTADPEIYVEWAPEWKAPYYAALGDPVTTPREIVRVTEAVVVGTVWKLTVERGFGTTVPAAMTLADTQAQNEAARITYSHSMVPMDAAAADKWFLVNDIDGWTRLPATTSNLYVRITGTGAGPPTEELQVEQAMRLSWALSNVLASGDATMNITDLTRFTTASLLAGDLLRIGDLYTGEIVALSGACTASGCPITRAQSGTTQASTVPVGTAVTLIERDGVFTNPVYLFAPTGATNYSGLANAYTAANGILADFAWAPQGAPVTGQAFVGGSAVSEYVLEACDPKSTPFVYDAPIQIVSGHQYLKSPGSGFGGSDNADTRSTGNAFWVSIGGQPSSATDVLTGGPGTTLEIKGWYVMPTDLDITQDTGNSTLSGAKTQRYENYLLVTIGQHTHSCDDPTEVKSCAREKELECNIVEIPTGYCDENWDLKCRCKDGAACPDCAGGTGICHAGPPPGTDQDWPVLSKPSIRCRLPETLESDSDLNIFWHGIHTRLSHWFHPRNPSVSSISPMRIPFTGMATVTVRGSDFGPADTWVGKDAKSMIELRGRSMAAKCLEVVHVSNRELLCKIPPLALTRQIDLNRDAKTVTLHVVVNKAGKQSRQTSADAITYEGVPGYFGCESRTRNSLDKTTCFQCCRSACIVDEFATGARKGGTTYAHCDATCNKYCGIVN
mmetsp:Transcript_57387/g.134769  ORF Transcript_57387/g.134769 Transcript_57387/m.134769 type:complete len:1427 (-) Transcript_57387:352-4632(-)